VLELEQTFGVRFAPAEIERMQTIGAIADVISQRQE
jgi:acyl carrier protein